MSARLRSLRCLRLLIDGWHTREQLAEALNVSDKTIRRYLCDIQDAGFYLHEQGEDDDPEPLFHLNHRDLADTAELQA